MSRFRTVGALVAVVAFVVVVAIAVAAPEGSLEPIHTYLTDPPNGPELTDAYGTAVSPDGQSLYALGYGTSTLNVFSRSKSGHLSLIQKKVNGSNFGGMYEPTAVVVSPDGKNVYVTSSGDSSIVTFSRNEHSGKLDYANVLTNGAEVQNMAAPCCQMAISHDGRNVYVPSGDSNSVVTFDRSNHGALTYAGAKIKDQGGVKGLEDAIGVVVSHDDQNVYAIGDDDNSLVSFDRSGKSGKLKYLDTKFDGSSDDKALESPCCSLSVSHDDKTVYVPADGEEAIGEMKRSTKTGKVSFWRAYRSSDKGFGKMTDPLEVIPSRDGKRVWVASYESSTVLSIKRSSQGKLKVIGKIQDGETDTPDLGGAWKLTESPDGKDVYSSNYNDSSLTAFARSK